MKIKKVLALILALTMCLCMFTVMPTVSAAENSLWENLAEEGGYRIDDGVKAPEGYEHLNVDGSNKSHLVTKEAYDLLETTIVLSNAFIEKSGGGIGGLVFSNTPSAAFTVSAPSQGTLSLFLRDNGSTGINVEFFLPSGDSTATLNFATVPYADEYEISFIKYKERGTEKTCMRINNTYIRNDNAYVKGFCNSNPKSYVTFYSNNRFIADVKFINNDDTTNRWISTNQSLVDYDGNVINDNSATEIKAKLGSPVASLSRYNLLENTLVLDNVKWNQSGSTWVSVNFATTRNLGTGNSSAAEWFFFRLEKYTSGTTEKCRIVWNDNWLAADIELTDKYEISFRNVNGTYALYVNNNIYNQNGNVKTFCENNNIKNCYIGFLPIVEFSADFKVIANNDRKGEWINSNGTYYRNVVGDTDDVRKVTGTPSPKDSIVTISKYDLLHGNMTLKNATFALDTKSDGSYFINSVLFGSIGGMYQDSIAGKLMCVNLTPKSVSNGVVETVDIALRQPNASGWGLTHLGNIPAASDYTYRFAKEGDVYYLYVNGTKMAENSFITTLGNAGILENCYVSLVTEKEFTAIPVFTESTWEQLDADKTANWTAAEADEASKVTLTAGAYIRQKNAFDIRNTSIVIDRMDCGEVEALDADVASSPLAVLTFAKNKTVIGGASATTKGISFGFRYVYVEDTDEEFIQVFALNSADVWEELGTIETARAYEISVAYSIENNNYTLVINDEALNITNNDEAINFFEGDSNDVYVIFGAENYDITADKITISKTVAYGDVDGDSERDIVDMVMVARGMASENDTADANQDGNVNMDDADVIRKIWFANGFNFIQ